MTREEFEAQKAIKKEVRDRFPNVQFPEVYMDNVWRGFSREHVSQAANKKMIVVQFEDKNGAGEYEAAIVSDEYKLVPHEVSLYHFMKAIEKSPEFGNPKYQISLLGYGEKMMATVTFPDLTMDIKDAKVGDTVSLRAICQNSVDTSWEHGIRLAGEVLRCSNGMRVPKELERHSKKHRHNLDVEDQLTALSAGMEIFSEQHKVWQKWTEMQIAFDQVPEVLNELPFSDKQKEEILLLPETGTGVRLQDLIESKEDVSLWRLNSISTQFITHELELTPARVQREELFTRSMQRIMHSDDFFRRAA